jgi:AAHS family 4-hydroxybenzoate transporter-like MFS transporter
MPLLGWRWLLAFGAVTTLASALVLAFTTPESLKFLFARQRASPQLWRTLLWFDPSLAERAGAELVWRGEAPEARGIDISRLFADGRRCVTPILWLALFAAQTSVYALALWLPTLLAEAGVEARTVAIAMTLFATSAAAGTLVFGRLVDRNGPRALVALPFGGIPVLIGLASAGADARLLIPLVALAGVSVNGGLQGLLIIAGQFYPTALRANGVGTAVFVSRFGSLLGPAVMGALLAHGAGLKTVFYVCTAPLAIAGLCIITLSILRGPVVGLKESPAQPAN